MEWYEYILIAVSGLIGGAFGPMLAKWVYKKFDWPWNN